MQDIKVSVIIPIYDVEEYLEECLVSALNQTLKEIEIICVNDGTPDNSMNIVNKYSEDTRIVIVNKENGGLSSARNAGLEVAKGEYIYFLDSDDYIAPETLEELYNDAKGNDLDIIFFDAESFYESEKLKKEQAFYADYYIREPIYGDIVTGPELFEKQVNDNKLRVSACLQLLRRQLLMDENIRFYEGIIHEDNLFSLECILEAKRVKHVAKQYYKRRVREGSIVTASKQINSSLGYFKTIEELTKRLKDKDFTDSQKDAIFKRMYLMQYHCFNNILDIDSEEVNQVCRELPLDRAIMYKLIVVRLAEERRRLNKSKASREKLKTNIAKWKYKNKKLKKENKKLIKENKRIKSKLFYKIARWVFYIPNLCIGFAKDYKNKGKAYACWKLKNKFSKKILVSVIISQCSNKAYLGECLKSLVDQTLKNIEVICINDGLDIKTQEVLEKYSKKDSRIRIINKKENLVKDIRNEAVSYAKGRYILFLDGNDFAEPTLCEKTCYKSIKDKADICIFGTSRFNMKTYEKEPIELITDEVIFPEKTPFTKANVKCELLENISGDKWSILFNKAFINTNDRVLNQERNSDVVRIAIESANKITYLKNRFMNRRVGILEKN